MLFPISKFQIGWAEARALAKPQAAPVMRTDPGSSGGGRLPSLDGWRAVSITMVLVSHCLHVAGFPSGKPGVIWWWFSNGVLGVRFFFIISGFLITYLLLLEHDQSGQVSLKRFYIRRALRILPVYFAFMLTLAGLGLFTPFRQSSVGWLHNLTFTTNFMDLGSLDKNWTGSHLWSLAVEEQFYLLWPGIFIATGVAVNWRRAWLILLIPILLAPLFRTLSERGWYPGELARFFTYLSFFNFWDSLSVGCLIAVLFARRREMLEALLIRHFKQIFVLGILLVVVPVILVKLGRAAPLVVPFGPTAQTLGFGALLAQSLLVPKHLLFRGLSWRWVSFIGVLSYSIYIWQQIFCTQPAAFGLGQVWWMSFPGWVIPAVGVAILSYYGLERPLLRLRTRFRQV